MEIKEKTIDDVVKDFYTKHIDQKHAWFLSGINKDNKPYQVFIFGGDERYSHYLNELLKDMKDNPSTYFDGKTQLLNNTVVLSQKVLKKLKSKFEGE